MKIGAPKIALQVKSHANSILIKSEHTTILLGPFKNNYNNSVVSIMWLTIHLNTNPIVFDLKFTLKNFLGPNVVSHWEFYLTKLPE